MNSVEELLEREPFFDAAILRHGFTDYMRDYDVIVGARQHPWTDVHRYQFVGCVDASCVSTIRPETFATSLPDDFVYSGPDYPEKPDPDGFVWGVRYSTGGLKYIANGARAREWSNKLGLRMHEVTIQTEAIMLRLVFSEVRYEFLGHNESALFPKQFPIPKSGGKIA